LDSGRAEFFSDASKGPAVAARQVQNPRFKEITMNRARACLVAAAVAMLGSVADAQLRLQPNPGLRPGQPVKLMKRGTGSFTSEFEPGALGLNRKNAYIMGYLAAVVYPDGLAKAADIDITTTEGLAYVNELNQNRRGPDRNFFETEFKAKFAYLFQDATFKWFAPPLNRDGYDPEAMVIDMPGAVIVVFRGTDRVGSAEVDSLEWNAGEWVRTDFRCALTDPGHGIAGKVHEGMWQSLRIRRSARDESTEFRRELLDAVAAADPENKKKLWLTGHSLGGGYVQAFAAYAEARGRNVQGAYAFAAPQIGDKAFATWLDGKLSNGRRLQRFEFLDDPITLIGPQPFFEPTGTRNKFDGIVDLKTGIDERLLVEVAGLAPAVAQIAREAIEGRRTPNSTTIDYDSLNYMCYHYWEWYVAGAFQALPAADRARFPGILTPLPTRKDQGCSRGSIDLALHGNPAPDVEDVREAVEELQYAVNEIIDSAKTLMANATGQAIPEGTYYLKLYKGGKFLDVSGDCFSRGEDGCEVQLWSLGQSRSNNKVTVKRDGVWYLMKMGDKVVEMKLDDAFEARGRVQTWGYNPFALNQKWLFCRVKKDHYVIVNAMNLKALDAVNDETGQNGGRLQTYRARDNDSTQVWVLEKAS
jgi:hypothetical protein